MQSIVNLKPQVSIELKDITRFKKSRVIVPLESMPFEIKPCVDIRLDLCKLLDRTSLLQDPSFRGERLAKRLFLQGEERSLTDIWLRIFPQSDHMGYELVDPSAADLKRCNNVFSQIVGYQNHIGYLEELAAPSFSGTQAIALVLNIMALARLEELLFVDGSIRLPCCASGQIASLRLTGVFCNGKSWYEQHGASAKISPATLRFFVTRDVCETTAIECPDTVSEDKHTYEHLSLEYSPDARFSRTRDLDRVVFEQFSLGRQEFQPSRKAYLFASRFLHTLTSQDLQKSLMQLRIEYPKIQELCKVLEEASSCSKGSSGLLGSAFLEFLRSKDTDVAFSTKHALLHEFFAQIVANKGSIFFQFIADKLKNAKKVSRISLMLAFCVLHGFFEDIRKKTVKARPMLYTLLKIRDEECSFLREKVGSLHKKATALPEEILKNPREVSLVKVLSHSTRVQIEQHWSNIHETGAVDEFLTLKRAFDHIAKAPMQQLRIVCKDLIEGVVQRCRVSEESLMAGITLEALMDAASEDERRWVLDELAAGSLKHLSSLLTQGVLAQATFTGDDIYAIFMICKYVVEKHKYFALKL